MTPRTLSRTWALVEPGDSDPTLSGAEEGNLTTAAVARRKSAGARRASAHDAADAHNDRDGAGADVARDAHNLIGVVAEEKDRRRDYACTVAMPIPKITVAANAPATVRKILDMFMILPPNLPCAPCTFTGLEPSRPEGLQETGPSLGADIRLARPPSVNVAAGAKREPGGTRLAASGCLATAASHPSCHPGSGRA